VPWNVLQYVAVCRSLWQCVAVCCSVSWCVQCGAHEVLHCKTHSARFVCVCVCLSVCVCAREIENVFVRLCFSLCPFLCLLLAFSFSLYLSCTSTHILLRALSLSLRGSFSLFISCTVLSFSLSLSLSVCAYM